MKSELNKIPGLSEILENINQLQATGLISHQEVCSMIIDWLSGYLELREEFGLTKEQLDAIDGAIAALVKVSAIRMEA